MKILNLIFLAFIVTSVISCDKTGEVPEITIDEFVGSWKATSAVFTNKANSSEEIDLISLGGELSFTMLEGGGVRTWFTIDSISDEWDSQAVLSGTNTLVLTPIEAERGVNTYEFVYEDNTLTLTNNDDSIDFTLSDAGELPATSVTIFMRN